MHPFLDTKKLTDEEIIERLGRAYSFLNNQVALGHTATVVSIKEVIQSLEIERRERMQKISSEEQNKKNPYANKPLELGNLED